MVLIQKFLLTIRTSIFSNQNCQLSLDDSGNFLLTYLDGDRHGIKKKLAKMFKQRKVVGLNRVSWWGNRGVQSRLRISLISNLGPETNLFKWA
jgi:hypothetical protein